MTTHQIDEKNKKLRWIPTFPGNALLWEIEKEESQDIIKKVIELLDEEDKELDLENTEVDADADYWAKEAEKNYQELLKRSEK